MAPRRGRPSGSGLLEQVAAWTIDLLPAIGLGGLIGYGVRHFGADLGYVGNETLAGVLSGVAAACAALLLTRAARAFRQRAGVPETAHRASAILLWVVAAGFLALAFALWWLAPDHRHGLAGAAATVGLAVVAAGLGFTLWRRPESPFRR